MRIPLWQMLIRLRGNELMNIIIDDRPNCKTIQRCVTAAASLRDPVLDDYARADVEVIGVNKDGIIEIEATV